MQEFDLIKQYFAPLSLGFAGSLGLTDDAAVFTPPAGHELVITKDAISEGVHFIGTESADLIAAKALRVNLSDLAAMGAQAICYFLALILPKNTPEKWVAKFADGLSDSQKEFGIWLAGGDTISTLGDKISISITAIGSVPIGGALRRNGAKIGDDIFVSGTLGDAALGLKLLQQSGGDEYIISRYLIPQPRLELGQKLRGIANSCMDISDGLVQDLGHICEASSVGAIVYLHKIPISTADAFEFALNGGDDYELLFTAPPEKAHLIPQNCTKIGRIIAGNSVKVLGKNEELILLDKKGFSHFS